ncbi:hypothetical protein BIY26_05285 [Brenneria goodwinii]|uniref:Uncharacterized protein n=1 Tax=Brenneria goodwinii TaxID=1109412 RepID=A0AAE8EQE2_9GAMM|nr:hypothetical protein AWC36_18045 [Brenneria goodwinii]RLM21812.1 hypothetical protein BIY28_10785 [Brenneria goodwinii]RLM27920.1 hypothetical protein BIY26_05285 [Brenneria goodwinii]
MLVMEILAALMTTSGPPKRIPNPVAGRQIGKKRSFLQQNFEPDTRDPAIRQNRITDYSEYR